LPVGQPDCPSLLGDDAALPGADASLLGDEDAGSLLVA